MSSIINLFKQIGRDLREVTPKDISKYEHILVWAIRIIGIIASLILIPIIATIIFMCELIESGVLYLYNAKSSKF